jgi:hypothetical protein
VLGRKKVRFEGLLFRLSGMPDSSNLKLIVSGYRLNI